ncbi:hypothetical protein [Flavobacterium sp. FlaQc-50]|jgi:hypothetical protein|uniref:hypothetical protein n=1 Tax=unclassified Flavobacterium TaxID=196869 RepID=UPI0037564B02
MDENSSNLIDGSADILEYGIDFFTENEAVKDFPIIGIAVKIGFAVKSISDRIFLKKMERFLFEYSTVTSLEKSILHKKIQLSDTVKKKAGEAVILLLDRFSDLNKPYFLAQCFSAYIEGRLLFDDFIRLGNAIDLSHSSDLYDFIKTPNNQMILDRLLRTGMAEISKNASAMTQSGSSPIILTTTKTELGEKFIELFTNIQHR